MTTFRFALITLLLGASAVPAVAGGFGIDLPRLDFPTGAETTRGCANPAGDIVICPEQGR